MIKADKEKSVERFMTCLDCDQLLRPTYNCKQCGCFMKLKVKVQHAKCPLGKW